MALNKPVLPSVNVVREIACSSKRLPFVFRLNLSQSFLIWLDTISVVFF